MQPSATPDTWHLTIEQPDAGYRFALDAFLLADFIPTTARSPLLDLGTGCGVIALLLARRLPQMYLVGLEFQARLAAWAGHNVRDNGLQQRLGIVQGDIRQATSLFAPESFGTVVCNPPYRAVGHGRLNPHPEKATARHELTVTLPQLLQAITHVLERRGVCGLIYHPSRLSELCARLEEARLRPRRLRLIHATAATPATMVLVEAVREGRQALTVLPPLCVYETSGVYSAEMQAIFRGRDLPSAGFIAKESTRVVHSTS